MQIFFYHFNNDLINERIDTRKTTDNNICVVMLSIFDIEIKLNAINQGL